MQNQVQHGQAYWEGVVIGKLFIGFLCGLAPLIPGIAKRGPIHITLGVVGTLASIGGSFILGWFLALPVAAVFLVIILVIPRPTPPRRFDDDDAYGEGFRRRGARDDDDDDYQAPRRSSRDGDDAGEPGGITDRPRRSRPRDDDD
jgi:hypothetical protein